jgi:hypothetical protein
MKAPLNYAWLSARVSIVVAISVLSGCSTYAASRYSISADTVAALRDLRGQSVRVGDFTAAQPGRTEITCRAVGPIKTPDGEAFEAFIRKALIDELRIAEVYSERAPITLTGRLDSLDFSSGLTDAAWRVGLTLASSNGRSLTVAEEYKFTSSWYGETGCNQTAHALMPAVQNVIRKIVQHPDFAGLIR